MDKSKIVFISGASSGIGEASARHLASKGYLTILASRRTERLLKLQAEIKQSGGEAYAVQLDVGELGSIQNAVRETLENFGKIDVMVNNAGFGCLRWLEELDPTDDISALIQTNLVGLIWLSQAVLPGMIAQRSGHIINIGSLASFIGTPTYTIYAASKFGVRGFTEALRREVSVWGISVSGLYPGAVDTEFKTIAKIQRKTGLTTPGFLRLQPEDVARVIEKLILHPRRSLVMPGIYHPILWLNSAFPQLVDWITYRRFVRRERLEK